MTGIEGRHDHAESVITFTGGKNFGTSGSSGDITLSQKMSLYSLIAICFNTAADGSSSTRGFILLPTSHTVPVFAALYCGTTGGYVRVEGDTNTKLSILATSFTNLYVTAIYGIK